jgi:hypothetical protein
MALISSELGLSFCCHIFENDDLPYPGYTEWFKDMTSELIMYRFLEIVHPFRDT